MSDAEHEEPLSNLTSEDRWGVEFPFEWDADELVSRRQLLRWSVWASGALFAGTGVLAALGYVRREVLTPGTPLEVHTQDSTLNATVAELPFYKQA